ncbi:hypothetical protein [Novosphingobium aquimarinum]|uniref:hypothetical protein n=1 Tax=Novosphingobium aquimarinum TaxID=2682494 RepID=UPI0012ECAF08|nr:hypothetical protein [Novosphingobium aquimarinum]
MLAKPGLRILAALVLMVVVLIAALLAVGTEDRGGLVTQGLQSAPREIATAQALSPSPREARKAAPVAMPMADEAAAEEHYEGLEETLVDDATGVDPSADVPPEPMLVPEGLTPEPMIEPGAGFGD